MIKDNFELLLLPDHGGSRSIIYSSLSLRKESFVSTTISDIRMELASQWAVSDARLIVDQSDSESPRPIAD